MLASLADVSYKPGKQLQIARLLWDGPKTLSELGEHIDADPSGLRRLLKRMEERGQVGFQPSGHSKPGRGRASGLWFLPDQARDAVLAADDDAGFEPSAAVDAHQGWVLITAPTQDVPALMDVFAAADALAAADWIAQLQGDTRSYLVVFPEEVGTQPVDNLAAALCAARLSCSSGVVAHVKRPEQVASNAQGVRAVYQRSVEAKRASEFGD